MHALSYDFAALLPCSAASRDALGLQNMETSKAMKATKFGCNIAESAFVSRARAVLLFS